MNDGMNQLETQVAAERRGLFVRRAGVISSVVMLSLVGLVTAGVAQQSSGDAPPAPSEPTGAEAPTTTTTVEPFSPTQLVPGTYVYEIIKQEPVVAGPPPAGGVTTTLVAGVTPTTSVSGTLEVEGSLGAQQRRIMTWLTNAGAPTLSDASLFEFGTDGIYLVSREESGTGRTVPGADFDPSPFELVVPYPAQPGKVWTQDHVSSNGCVAERIWVKVVDEEETLYLARRGMKAVRLIRLTERASTGNAGCAPFRLTETANMWISWQYGLVQMELFEGHSTPEADAAATRVRLIGVPSGIGPTTTTLSP